MFAKLCLVTLLSIAAAPNLRAAEPSLSPRRFSAYIGGFLGASYSVELREGVLTYTTFDRGRRNPRHSRVTPTAAQWREFRQTLDELNVWQWRAEYPSGGTVDGTQ